MLGALQTLILSRNGVFIANIINNIRKNGRIYRKCSSEYNTIRRYCSRGPESVYVSGVSVVWDNAYFVGQIEIQGYTIFLNLSYELAILSMVPGQVNML